MAQYDPYKVPEWVTKEYGELEPGFYEVAVTSISDETPSKSGKYQITVGYEVVEPTQSKGRKLTEWHTLGTDWTGFAASKYKKLLQAAGVTPSGQTGTDFMALQGQHLILRIYHEGPTRKDGSPNPFANKARIGDYFSVGSKTPGTASTKPAAPRRATMTQEDE